MARQGSPPPRRTRHACGRLIQKPRGAAPARSMPTAAGSAGEWTACKHKWARQQQSVPRRAATTAAHCTTPAALASAVRVAPAIRDALTSRCCRWQWRAGRGSRAHCRGGGAAVHSCSAALLLDGWEKVADDWDSIKGRAWPTCWASFWASLLAASWRPPICTKYHAKWRCAAVVSGSRYRAYSAGRRRDSCAIASKSAAWWTASRKRPACSGALDARVQGRHEQRRSQAHQPACGQRTTSQAGAGRLAGRPSPHPGFALAAVPRASW